MYPYFRTLKTLISSKFSKKIAFKDKSTLKMRVWLSDIDVYPELNNGRHLTLMDLGRFDLGFKIGLFKVLKVNNWGLMVAGNFTRYRRRLKLFQSFCLDTQLIAYDDKWYYFYQETRRKKVIHSAALIRTAIISKDGIVPSIEVAAALQIKHEPGVPKWVSDWIALNNSSPTIN